MNNEKNIGVVAFPYSCTIAMSLTEALRMIELFADATRVETTYNQDTPLQLAKETSYPTLTILPIAALVAAKLKES